MTVFNASVNFYIYLAKHWRVILGYPESAASDRTEVLRLRTSVVVHNNHHYPPINTALSLSGNGNGFNNHGRNGNGRLPCSRRPTQANIANQSEHAIEETKMLVNVIVSAPAVPEDEESASEHTQPQITQPQSNNLASEQKLPSILHKPDL